MTWKDLGAFLDGLISPTIEVMDADIKLSGYFSYRLAGFIGKSYSFKLKFPDLTPKIWTVYK